MSPVPDSLSTVAVSCVTRVAELGEPVTMALRMLSHSGDGHRFVHAVDGHVFRPRIFERKDLHHEIGDLRLFKGGDGG